MRLLFLAVFMILFSCGGDISTSEVQDVKSEVKAEKTPVKADTIESLFSFDFAKDTVENGEEVKHHKNGVVHIRGMMKNGKRTGLWKSWYEDGTPWSETTFKDGIKTGKTITWYENGKKRYEGFYTNNIASGKWIYWDDKGNIIEPKDFGTK